NQTLIRLPFVSDCQYGGDFNSSWSKNALACAFVPGVWLFWQEALATIHTAIVPAWTIARIDRNRCFINRLLSGIFNSITIYLIQKQPESRHQNRKGLSLSHFRKCSFGKQTHSRIQLASRSIRCTLAAEFHMSRFIQLVLLLL